MPCSFIPLACGVFSVSALPCSWEGVLRLTSYSLLRFLFLSYVLPYPCALCLPFCSYSFMGAESSSSSSASFLFCSFLLLRFRSLLRLISLFVSVRLLRCFSFSLDFFSCGVLLLSFFLSCLGFSPSSFLFLIPFWLLFLPFSACSCLHFFSRVLPCAPLWPFLAVAASSSVVACFFAFSLSVADSFGSRVPFATRSPFGTCPLLTFPFLGVAPLAPHSLRSRLVLGFLHMLSSSGPFSVTFLALPFRAFCASVPSFGFRLFLSQLFLHVGDSLR